MENTNKEMHDFMIDLKNFIESEDCFRPDYKEAKKMYLIGCSEREISIYLNVDQFIIRRWRFIHNWDELLPNK